jgi:hypothetical protein
MPIFHVSVPDVRRPGSSCFQGEFDTREEAIEYAQDVWGADEHGDINLITEYPDDEEDDT